MQVQCGKDGAFKMENVINHLLELLVILVLARWIAEILKQVGAGLQEERERRNRPTAPPAGEASPQPPERAEENQVPHGLLALYNAGPVTGRSPEEEVELMSSGSESGAWDRPCTCHLRREAEVEDLPPSYEEFGRRERGGGRGRTRRGSTRRGRGRQGRRGHPW